jgi:syndecan 1
LQIAHSTFEIPWENAAPAAASDGGGGGGQVQLKLCDCERATGPPNGLSCDKEGWFVSSFERQGQWVAGGGYVPLSHAICCRPCLPKELPPDPSGRIPEGQAHPLAVISLGCHGSTDELGTRCEQNAGSFVAGFSEAVKVFTTPGE